MNRKELEAIARAMVARGLLAADESSGTFSRLAQPDRHEPSLEAA